MKYKEIEAKTRGIDLPVTAVNENGDNVIIDCADDCYRVATLQKMGGAKQTYSTRTGQQKNYTKGRHV
jgi:hypothetical protein